MRTRILVAAVLAAIAVGTTAIATPSKDVRAAGEIKCKMYTLQDFRPFADRVWRLDRWERKPAGRPKDAAIRKMRAMRGCAVNSRHRVKMKEYWKKAKRTYYRHRTARIETQQWEEAINPPGLATLEAIAACESGGDPGAVSSDGSYRGKYQFDYGTWESVGGSGDPAAAPEKEQDERAAALYNMSGSSPWPVCG